MLEHLWYTHRTVKSECDQHEEEDDGPEHGPVQRGDRLRVHDEHQTRT